MVTPEPVSLVADWSVGRWHFVQVISDRSDTLVFSGIRDVVRALFVADDATAAKVTQRLYIAAVPQLLQRGDAVGRSVACC